MSSMICTEETLLAENLELRARLEEAEETLRAIRTGEVDALVVNGASGPQVFILQTSDAESNRFRSDILAKVSDAVIAVDSNQHVIYLNSAAGRQYGIAASEALGRSLSDLYENIWASPDDEMKAAGALREEGHWLGRSIHVKKSGEIIHVESSVSNLLAPDGSNSGLLSVVRDITEGSHAEQALRDSEERYRALFNTIDEGFCIIEMIFDAGGKPVDYRFLQVSPSFEKHTGLRDVAGKKVSELIPTHEAHWFDAYGKVALTGEPIRFENHSEGMDRWFDVHASRFGEPEKHLVAVLFNDITPRKLAEKDLMAHAEELARADRRKDEFLAMLAHELRNPLAPLRNASEILQIEEVSPRERAQAQRLIRRQIENMSRMIDDLLDVSRITEGKIELRKEPVSLEAILNSAATLVKTACAAQGQELTVSLPSEPIHLSADPTRLEQVFGNLLGNASKYGGDGCRISLSAERVPGAEPPQVIVRVSDNGTGIDPELLPRIFDLFVQASRSLDRAHGGLGIGLTVVSRLVKMHDGSIEARSDGLGRGAEFTVHLPILSSPAPEPSRAAAPEPRNKGLRLLIVDDNRDSAESMAMLQELAGNETRIAHHGSEAIRIAAEFLPQAVLLDIGLPGMDGFEVARRLRAIPSLADCFLIALTGYGSDEDRQRTQAAGFDEHLVKPADLNLLRRWLEARK